MVLWSKRVGDEVTRTRQVSAIAVAARRAYLDVVEGAAAQRIEVGEAPMVIGRSREAGLRLDVDGVSRKHARLDRSGGIAVSLVDLGAKNGTFLNGERVGVAALHHGDQIQIGPVVLRFSLLTEGSDADAVSRPAEGILRASLSAREWEVATHVAQGLTNVQIAAQLGIGRRTVATHLERIYERLGIHTRAALANRVARDGGAG
ncbi:MAG: FHA domain-containing protein [Myxococcota bacterium]